MKYICITLIVVVLVVVAITIYVKNKSPVSLKTLEEDYAAKIANLISYDYEFIEDTKSLSDIMLRYKLLLTTGKQEGFTPILIVPDSRMYEVLNIEDRQYDYDYTPATITNIALSLDPKKVLDRLLAGNIPVEEDEEYDYMGEYKKSRPISGFESLVNYQTNIPYQKLMVLKLPTDNPWEDAAWIPMGGFNACPNPDEQEAVFKYWYDTYGAIPAVASADIWELYVEKPVEDEEAAKLLALEQFGFCGDIVWQGVGSVNALAGTLVGASVWYFWWD